MKNLVNFYIETFFKDFRIAMSYKLQFILSFISIFFSFFFLVLFGSFVDQAENATLNNYGNSYFIFLFFGILAAEITSVLINTMPANLKTYQQTGIFEELMLCGRSEIQIILASLIYPIFRLLLRLALYLITLSIFMDRFIIFDANTFLALILFSISIIGISLVGCAVTIILKGSSIIPQAYLLSSSILCGVAFPIEVLPNILQILSKIYPTTHFLEIVRNDYSITGADVTTNLFYLLVMAVLLNIFGISIIKMAINKSKKDGTLLFH